MRSAKEFLGSLTRREFSRRIVGGVAGSAAFRGRDEARPPSTVALVRSPARAAALETALGLAGEVGLRGKEVLLKCSYNSADPCPATTHPDTLAAVVRWLRRNGCAAVRLVERSGMGDTREVLERLGVFRHALELDIEVLPLEEIPDDGWRVEKLEGWHWKRGVEVPRFLTRESTVVQVCNLKTHRFAGDFSASLKNSVGLVAKHSRVSPPYNFMVELHSSPDQRQMIAEVNQVYTPALVVMDAIDAFIEGGPERGETGHPGVVAASRDRVAIDALGVALLRIHGADSRLTQGGVFEQGQIKRAAELGIGCSSGRDVSFVTSDPPSAAAGERVSALLRESHDEKN